MGNFGSKKNSQTRSKINNIQYKYINGRKYYDEEIANDLTPIDIEEIDRAQSEHYTFKHMFGGNISAPVEEYLSSGCKVLDVGCGSGIWILELATENPKSHFFGVDLSPIFPDQIKPANTTFIQTNILHGLPFEDNEFDYVHIGHMCLALTEEQWQNIIPELIRVTKPSCYIEFSETDIICSSAGPIYTKIIDSLKQYITSSGLNPKGAKLISNWIKKHSPNQLININEVIKKQPLGLWGGELGKLNSENFLEFFKMMAPRLCKYLNITQDEYLKLLNNCKDYEWDQYKPRMNYIRVWAMKVGNGNEIHN
ncbi:S-adenosyl-L-methionine-dependent methyltransferase [Rhizophagus irregularis]|uniref:S-adenosyl-L-methionine-dependent methyltransferase n=2 Tax=Rhizophagus irregularis TaxID=588596 RepID=A0A2I1FBM8_9GLOM|nr:hypothetical protein GLOIN_2v1814222 [Rhizophagus irregularis DAOM 181602=DAOM 197198]PKB99827.1 S-adenosyl-L-methionine-dependent methyltransferase [Rhizophagus irregularis]PKY31802.1 S-adenosyl-L-methionine-dependent methyltransferase [Rhizophagus irregularis]POG61283.1 hypothetical protein GLOIN_2v1814222 [Rhizophagus irregularis DAOM 181602=DAOM 197198]|eukprot:XP_025168149.1 hypothetical protein GLOIN_2v1814222 [Rhizophagus irregularis DAOM 181602=DAOM 197198]